MRGGAALLAAALLVLAAAGGCKPSSLSPLWIDTKGPEAPDKNINGSWRGTTDSGGLVTFIVSSERISDVLLDHRTPACVNRFELAIDELLVQNSMFHEELVLDPQGRFVIDGTFANSTTCTGTYLFEGLAATQSCANSGTGSFTAYKQ